MSGTSTIVSAFPWKSFGSLQALGGERFPARGEIALVSTMKQHFCSKPCAHFITCLKKLDPGQRGPGQCVGPCVRAVFGNATRSCVE